MLHAILFHKLQHRCCFILFPATTATQNRSIRQSRRWNHSHGSYPGKEALKERARRPSLPQFENKQPFHQHRIPTDPALDAACLHRWAAKRGYSGTPPLPQRNWVSHAKGARLVDRTPPSNETHRAEQLILLPLSSLPLELHPRWDLPWSLKRRLHRHHHSLPKLTSGRSVVNLSLFSQEHQENHMFSRSWVKQLSHRPRSSYPHRSCLVLWNP